jgi:hypothetical protein
MCQQFHDVQSRLNVTEGQKIVRHLEAVQKLFVGFLNEYLIMNLRMAQSGQKHVILSKVTPLQARCGPEGE